MFNLFCERPLSEYLTEKKEQIYEIIESESESNIFEVDAEYIDAIYKNEYINIPQFKFKDIYIEAREKKVEGNPKNFNCSVLITI